MKQVYYYEVRKNGKVVKKFLNVQNAMPYRDKGYEVNIIAIGFNDDECEPKKGEN